MKFCNEIEINPSLAKEYHEQVVKIKDWYKKAYEKYSKLLVSEAMRLSSEYDDTLFPDESIFDLDFHFSTKSSYFSISDALVKLILSMYSFGPSEAFLDKYGIKCPEIKKTIQYIQNPSWIKIQLNEVVLSEILARVLRVENAQFSFDLAELLANRTSRNTLTHQAKADFYNSAIRSYNSIRNMLVFIAPEYEDILLSISFSPTLSFDEFMSSPQAVDFSAGTNVLVVGSAHDISISRRETIANLAWDIVIDLDGYSDFGGLLSCVQHAHIQKEVLYGVNANNKHSILADSTLWYRCGEYLIQNSDRSQINIPCYVDFHSNVLGITYDKNKQRNKHTTEIFTEILKKAHNLHRTVHIVALTDDKWTIQTLIDAESNLKNDDYSITWVGSSSWTSSDCLHCFDEDEADMNAHFRLFRLPLQSAFDMFYKYSNQWQVRSSAVQLYKMPCADGVVTLSQNELNNLRIYFKPLYLGCENDEGVDSEESKAAFYRGNLASWNTISYKYAVPLKDQEEIKWICDSIKSLLGTRQDNGDNRLFFIRHSPGIGGTTLTRQIVWELHHEYPVLEVHSYDSPGLIKQIENAYDNIVRKQPIILISDDSFPFIDSLCDDIRRLERRCILIVACREGNALLTKYPKSGKAPFNGISDAGIRILRDRFRNSSNLPKTELIEKDEAFPRVFTNRMMKTPLIIGLYYMERDFNIESYVKKALVCCRERRYEDFVAFLALCNRYGQKTIPASFTKAWLTIPRDLICSVPGIDSIITLSRDAANVDVYQFKHLLLADEFLKQYAEKRFTSRSNVRDAVFYLTQQLIDKTIVGIGRNIFHREELTLLIKLLIQNKKDPTQDFSDLMMDVAVPEYQRLLLKMLSEKFKPIADESLKIIGTEEVWDDADRLILRITAHAYAHLGRMYSKGDEQNFAKAAEMTELSFKYSPDHDPIISHMAGMALLEKLENSWKMLLERGEPIYSNDIASFQQDFEKAEKFFDMTTDYGQPDYGIPSKLRLYYNFLQFIYNVKTVKSHREARETLNDYEYGILGDFAKILDDAESFSEIDEYAHEKVKAYRDKYEAKILFGDYGAAVEYYQNKVDSLHGSNGKITEYEKALKALVFIKIQKARKDMPGHPFYDAMKEANLRELKSKIEQLLAPAYNKDSFSEYSERSRLYHYWMLLAKRLSESIDVGITRVQAWKEMEEDRRNRNLDPEPFYYEIALLYLSALSGSEKAREKVKSAIIQMTHMIEDHRYNQSKGNAYRIHDLVVGGHEMGQLLDISYYQREEDYYSVIKKEQIFEGIIEDVQSGYAKLKIYSPPSLSGDFVKVPIGRRSENSLSDQQLGHKICCFAGISFDGLTALSKTAADITTGEILELSALQAGETNTQGYKRSDNSKDRTTTVTQSSYKQPIDVTVNSSHKIKAERVDAPQASNANPQIIGRSIKIKPIETTESGCIGIFEINDIQYTGQIVYAKIKKNRVDKVRKQIIRAKEKNEAIQGFKIDSVSAGGIYILRLA